jgi:hypothetical protein
MKKIMTPKFRVSFANVFEPKGFAGQDPKFSVTMLIPKTTDIKELKAALKEAVLEKWPNETQRPKKLINPIKDGDTDVMDDGTLRSDKYPEMKGHWVLTASSKQRPGVVDENVQPIIDKQDFYSGCYARATLTCYAYAPSKDRPQSKCGVGFGLQNIQKLYDGEAFGGKSKPEDDFGPVLAKPVAVEQVDDFMA